MTTAGENLQLHSTPDLSACLSLTHITEVSVGHILISIAISYISISTRQARRALGAVGREQWGRGGGGNHPHKEGGAGPRDRLFPLFLLDLFRSVTKCIFLFRLWPIIGLLSCGESSFIPSCHWQSQSNNGKQNTHYSVITPTLVKENILHYVSF